MAALRRPGPCEQVILVCQKCKVFLENIKGFYERHPEIGDDQLKT
jgi:hypothetical protein